MKDLTSALAATSAEALAHLSQQAGQPAAGDTSAGNLTTSGPSTGTPSQSQTQQAQTTPTQATAQAVGEQSQQPAQSQQTTSQEVALDDNALYRLADGTVLSGKEIKNGYLRQSDYTRKTQEVAQLRQQAEQVLQRYQQLEAYVNDPNAQLAALVQAFGPQAVAQALAKLVGPQQPQMNPEEIATLGQVQQVAATEAERRILSLQQQLAQAQEELRQFTQQSIQEERDRNEYLDHKRFFDAEVAKVLAENPILQDIDPLVEQKLRYLVLQQQPQTREQAVEALRNATKQELERIDRVLNARVKQSVVQQQQLVQNNIEPPGGTGIQPAPAGPFVNKDGRPDWKGIANAAVAYFNQRRQQQ